MNKYQPLADRLAALAETNQQIIEFDFSEIADLVGGLPSSALQHKAWWANDSKVEAVAWRAAGWHVKMVNLDRQRVRFARGQVGGSHRATRDAERSAAAAVPGIDPVGNGADGVELDVRVRFTWQPAGAVVLDPTGCLRFPYVFPAPGIYRMMLWNRPGQTRSEVYIGEADDLRRRWYNYRNPGLSQQTSLRINELLRHHLAAGGHTALAIATVATLESGGQTSPLPLTRKSARVLAEHAALAMEYVGGGMAVINRDKGAIE